MPTKKRKGRKADPKSKSGKVRALLNSGLTAAKIAKKVGCTVGLVYNIKSTLGKSRQGRSRQGATGARSTAKRGPGRPRKAIAGVQGVEAILASIQDSEKERAQMRAALERIQSIIRDALA